MGKYHKTAVRRPRLAPAHKVRIKGSRDRLDLRKLPWWWDATVMRLLPRRGRSRNG